MIVSRSTAVKRPMATAEDFVFKDTCEQFVNGRQTCPMDPCSTILQDVRGLKKHLEDVHRIKYFDLPEKVQEVFFPAKEK